MVERAGVEISVLELRRRRVDPAALGWDGDLASVLVRSEKQQSLRGQAGAAAPAGRRSAVRTRAEQRDVSAWNACELAEVLPGTTPATCSRGAERGGRNACLHALVPQRQHPTAEDLGFVSGDLSTALEAGGAHRQDRQRGRVPVFTSRSAQRREEIIERRLAELDAEVRASTQLPRGDAAGRSQRSAGRRPRATAEDWGGGLADVLAPVERTAGRVAPRADGWEDEAHESAREAPVRRVPHVSVEEWGGSLGDVLPSAARRRPELAALRWEAGSTSAAHAPGAARGHPGTQPAQGAPVRVAARWLPSSRPAAPGPRAPVPEARRTPGVHTGARHRPGVVRRGGLNLEQWPRVTAESREAPDTAWDEEYAASLAESARRGRGAAWWPSLSGGYAVGGSIFSILGGDGDNGGGIGTMAYESLLGLDDGVKRPGLTTFELQRLDKVTVSEEQAEAENACTICLEGLAAGSKATQLACGHLFHTSCIERWLSDHVVCPLCRSHIGTQEER
jgi:hypothetical protein